MKGMEELLKRMQDGPDLAAAFPLTAFLPAALSPAGLLPAAGARPGQLGSVGATRTASASCSAGMSLSR